MTFYDSKREQIKYFIRFIIITPVVFWMLGMPTLNTTQGVFVFILAIFGIREVAIVIANIIGSYIKE